MHHGKETKYLQQCFHNSLFVINCRKMNFFAEDASESLASSAAWKVKLRRGRAAWPVGRNESGQSGVRKERKEPREGAAEPRTHSSD